MGDNLYGHVDSSPNAAQSGWRALRVSPTGEAVVRDFLMDAVMEGLMYHIRAGNVATGVAMDSTLTDTDAEMCVDAGDGVTIIPVNFNIAFDDIATATTVRVAVKAVGTASNAGTAFIPIPLLQGGTNASATARVQNNGAVQVPVEVFDQTTPLTACRRLWQYNAVSTETPTTDTPPSSGSIATVAAGVADLNYVGKGTALVYVQAAATTAFPLYFASLDFIEILTANL